MNFSNKVVVITGASSGIGRACALKFAQKGAKVFLAARRVERLEEVQKEIFNMGSSCTIVKTDVTKKEDIENLFNKVEETYGKLDILINNAGKGLKASLLDITSEYWQSLLDTNLTSVFLCTQEAVKKMLKSKSNGYIITISSIAGLYGAPNYAAYCASKHAVTGFKRSVKWELRKKGIKCLTIHPGRVNTEFFNTYAKRPSRKQMLSSFDIAQVVLAHASGSNLKVWGVRALNLLRRLKYLIS